MDVRHWTTDGIGLFDTGERYWSCEMRQILRISRDTPADFHLLLQHVHPVDRRAFYAVASSTQGFIYSTF
jgi:hypothetical protein